jgi:4-amino-4-deoxy-L-arabinose transferase-like glycosyltransferase
MEKMIAIKKNQINFLYFTVIFFVIIRIILSFLTPIIADEAYYLQWSYHPALSYIDHPGMTAWINSFFISIFQEPLLAIRIASWVCLIFTLIFIFKTIFCLTGDKSKSLLGTVIYLLIPYNFIAGITMQIDQPLLLFASVGFYFLFKYIKEENKKYLYLISLFFGLAFLSKYMIIIPILFILIYLLTKNKKLILNMDFMFSMLFFFLIISPIIIWNYSNNWLSFTFHTSRVGQEALFKTFFEFIVEQFFYITPMIWLSIFKTKKHITKEEEKVALILFASVLIFFLFFSLKTKIWSHWTTLAYFPLTIYLSTILTKEKLKKLIRNLLFFIGLLVFVLGITGPKIFLVHQKYQDNYNLSKKIEKEVNIPIQDITILADYHGSAGQLSYYLKKQVYMATEILDLSGRWGTNQHVIWKKSKETFRSSPFIIFCSSNFENILKENFSNVQKLNVKLFVIEDHIKNKNFYLCY